MSDSELMARIERLESLDEIRQLAAKYSLSLDMRDLDAIRLTKFVRAHRHLSPYKPRILVSVGLQKPAHLLGLLLALDVHNAAIPNR